MKKQQLPLAVLLITILLVSLRAAAAVIENTIVITRCRANCYDQFAVEDTATSKDAGCLASEACVECWEMCSHLVNTPEEYDWMCSPQHQDLYCTEGCTASCSFINNLQDKDGESIESYAMSGVVHVIDATHLHVTAEMDLLGKSRDEGFSIAYALLYSVQDQWIYYATSMSPELRVAGAHNGAAHLRFLLLAVTSRELVAWTDPSLVTTTPVPSTTEPLDYDLYEYYYYESFDDAMGLPSNLEFSDYRQSEDTATATESASTTREPTTTETTTTMTTTTAAPSTANQNGPTTERIHRQTLTTLAVTSRATSVGTNQESQTSTMTVTDIDALERKILLLEKLLGMQSNQEDPLQNQDSTSLLDNNALLLIVLGFSTALILIVFAVAVFLLRNNSRVRRELLRLSAGKESHRRQDPEGGAVEGGSGERRNSTLPWKRGDSEKTPKPMKPWQPKNQMITIDAKTMQALQLPLLHSTPRKQVDIPVAPSPVPRTLTGGETRTRHLQASHVVLHGSDLEDLHGGSDDIASLHGSSDLSSDACYLDLNYPYNSE